MDPATPETRKKRTHPWRNFSRRTLITLAVIIVLLIAVRIALPFILRSAINSRLQKIPEYTGHVEQVDVAIWRGAYALERIVVQKRNGEKREPYFQANRVDFSLAWRELFHGRFLGDAELDRPKITLIAAPTTEDTQITADKRWQDAINDIFPIDVTYLKITDGEVRYINQKAKPKVDVRIAHLNAMATGLRNRPSKDSGEFPSTIVLEGETIGSGKLKLSAQLEPLAIDPHFLAKMELENVQLVALNEFLEAYAGVDVSKGTFSVYLEAVARDGHYEGYFKPFFDQIDFSTPPGKHTTLTHEVWEWFVKTFAWVFKNHPRDEVATKVPFSGEFKNLDFHTWETFKNLVHHAFVQPFQKKLDSKSPGGAGADAKGVLPKAEEKEKPTAEKK